MSTAFIPIAPARILEIISPAGFEQHFEELAALFAHGGPPDLSRLMTLAQKYDLELDMRQIEKMMASIISTVGYQEG